jgi:F0F1-type ATP synthase membrane subunit c/vacuolar-type H+-ATPase subunit K
MNTKTSSKYNNTNKILLMLAVIAALGAVGITTAITNNVITAHAVSCQIQQPSGKQECFGCGFLSNGEFASSSKCLHNP